MMSQATQGASHQPPQNGPYPHSCEHCEKLVFDERKLSWIERIRLRHTWSHNRWLDFLASTVLLPTGITIADVVDKSNSCLFLNYLVTALDKSPPGFTLQRTQEQLLWRLSPSKGLHVIDIGPFPLETPTLLPREAQFFICRIKGMTSLL